MAVRDPAALPGRGGAAGSLARRGAISPHPARRAFVFAGRIPAGRIPAGRIPAGRETPVFAGPLAGRAPFQPWHTSRAVGLPAHRAACRFAGRSVGFSSIL